MRAKDLKNNEKIIKLLDGEHKIAIDFNAFAALEEIYGDIRIVFKKFTGGFKFEDIKNFITAGINACIEDSAQHYTAFEVGKLLSLKRMKDYMTILTELMNDAMIEGEETEKAEKK